MENQGINMEDIKDAKRYLNNQFVESLSNIYRGVMDLVAMDEINIDFMKPFVFLSHRMWLDFMCIEGQYSVDSATHFMEGILFTVNFHREYLRGASESEDGGLTEDTREELSRVGALKEGEPLNFAVADEPLEDGTIPVYRIGSFTDGVIETRLFEPERYPEEAMKERAERLEKELEKMESKDHLPISPLQGEE